MRASRGGTTCKTTRGPTGNLVVNRVSASYLDGMAKRFQRRARRSAEEWSRLVAEWRDSGVAAEVFAAERGVSRTSLFKWTARLKREAGGPTRSAKFVAVDVVGDGPGSSSSSAASGVAMAAHEGGRTELLTLSGRVIRWSGGIDVDALAGVLEVAERC